MKALIEKIQSVVGVGYAVSIQGTRYNVSYLKIAKVSWQFEQDYLILACKEGKITIAGYPIGSAIPDLIASIL